MTDNIRYLKIFETLKSDILSGRYASPRSFPSAMALANRFKTTRATIRRALDQLRNMGFVGSRQGAGTYVTKAAMSRKIGLVVPDHGRSEFFPAIVKEISRLAQKESYSLLFGEVAAETDAKRAEQVENLAREFIGQNVSGVIFQPMDYVKDSEAINRKVLSLFDAAKIPVVLCDYDFVDSPDRSAYDVVGINNVEAGALMVKHLLAVGVRNVHFHLKPFAPQSHKNFIRGAVSECRDRVGEKTGKNVLVCDPDDVEKVRKYYRKNRPDAFVCGNDSTAAKLKKTLWKIGIGVPQDLLLTGMNDLQIATLLTPPLTTVHLPCEQIAEAAFYRLLARIASPEMPATEVFLPVRLVVRDSTKKVSVTKRARKK